MKKSFDYSRYSAVHRHQSQRRVLKKLVQMLGILGWLLLLIQVVFIIMWGLAKEDFDKDRLFKLAAVYLGLGVGAFVLRAVLGRILEAKSSRRRSRRAAASHHARASRAVPAALDAAEAEDEPGRRGSVLVMVLVIAALMSGLVLQAQVSAKLSHRVAAAQLTETRLRLAATDVVRGAMQTLADDPDLRTDHLDEAWAQPRESIDPSGIHTRVHTIDLNRFFDLNNLSLPVRPSVRPAAAALVDLLSLCGEYAPAAKVDALQDWVDTDDEGFHESGYYRERDQPCAPPNRALYAWNEVTWVDGFSREDFARTTRPEAEAPFQGRLADCLTLLPVPRESAMPINLNTAGEETILGVVGIANDDLMRRIVARRGVRPLQPADAMALAIDPDLIQQLAPYVGVRSTFFRIQAVAFLAGEAQSIEAVVHRDDDGKVEVVQWAL